MTEIICFAGRRVKPCCNSSVFLSQPLCLQLARIFLPEITNAYRQTAVFSRYRHGTLRSAALLTFDFAAFMFCLLSDFKMIGTILNQPITVPNRHIFRNLIYFFIQFRINHLAIHLTLKKFWQSRVAAVKHYCCLMKDSVFRRILDMMVNWRSAKRCLKTNAHAL